MQQHPKTQDFTLIGKGLNLWTHMDRRTNISRVHTCLEIAENHFIESSYHAD